MTLAAGGYWSILGIPWPDLAKIGFVLVMLLQIVPVLVWLERKVSAAIQSRIGPNRVAVFGVKAWGFFQPLADAVKLIFKEDMLPQSADRVLYYLGPALVMIPPMVAFTVIPFGNRWGDVDLVVSRAPVGVLLVMSVLSIAVYGIAFGGWASNSKYSLLGGLRSSAQMISYEMSLGLSIITALMITGASAKGIGTVDLQSIVHQQAVTNWNAFGGGDWLLLPSGLIGMTLFYIAALAENNRVPFDLPECEAELVGGYHTEYSSMKFAMFSQGEYVAMTTMSALFVTLWWGGWHFPWITNAAGATWVDALLSHGVFAVKTGVVLFLYIWIRWTLPRFRYDQLMNLGWKVLIPLSLANLAVVAVIGVLRHGHV